MALGSAVAELVVKVTTDTKSAAGDIDQTASKFDKFQSGVSKAAVPAAAALAAVGAAAVSAGRAAAEDAQAQAVLAKTMENTTGANSAQVAAMEDYIAKMSMATGVADDELRPAMGNLLRATGDAAESQKAMSAALDISAATGKSVESVSTALAKAYAGSTGSLKKLVPSLSDATLESGNMNKIMAELSDTVGGSAAASAETAAGQFKIFQVAMGEAQEEAGAALLPVMTKLSGVLVTVAKWIGENTTLFVVIAGVIGTVAAAVLVVNAALKVYQATLLVVQVVQKATWLAALGPIALVIAAIAAVIAIIVILWNKSETFRSIVKGVWGAFKNAVEDVTEAIRATWNWIGNLIQKIGNISLPGFIEQGFKDIRAAVEAAWNWVGNLIGRIGNISVPGVIENAFNQIKTAVEGAWNKVGDLVAAIGRISVPGLAVTVFNNIKSAVEGAIDAVERLIGWLGKIHVPSIHIPGVGKSAPAPTVPNSILRAAPTAAGLAPRASSGSPSAGIVVNVTGAIDPEATARQIRRILAGHDRRMGLAPA